MSLERVPTGIRELDDILGGGFLRNTLTLISGNPGTGKTILSTQYLYNGALKYGEKGMYVSFSETKADHYRNMKQLGMDLAEIERRGLFRFMDFATVKGEGMVNTLNTLLDEVVRFGAKRLVIDSVSAIVQNLEQEDIRIFFHSVLYRLIKTIGVTCILIGEVPLGEEGIGFGIEEFVADGVISLAYFKGENVEKKLLSILKMRGIAIGHSTFEYLIDKRYGGIELIVLPARHPEREIVIERLSTGVEGLDRMLMGGIFSNSITMIHGAEGVGKTTLSLQFAVSSAKSDRRVLYISFEEPINQIKKMLRNYKFGSGDLDGRLFIDSYIPEALTPVHYYRILKDRIEDHDPSVLILDSATAIQRALRREDFLPFLRYVQLLSKDKGLTTFITVSSGDRGRAGGGISSIADNVLLMGFSYSEGVQKRRLLVAKTRGSDHDRRIVPFEITGEGMTV